MHTKGIMRPPLGKKIVSCEPGGQKNGQSGGRDSFFFFFLIISFFID